MRLKTAKNNNKRIGYSMMKAINMDAMYLTKRMNTYDAFKLCSGQRYAK